MDNQVKLLEMLQEIKTVAAASQNKLTKEEIKAYLGDRGLQPQQMQAVYQYLGENQIEVEGYDFVPPKKEQPIEKNDDGLSRGEKNLNLYRQELQQISGDLRQEEDLILSFLKGRDEVKSQIIEKYLCQVVELSKRYEKRRVPQEEIIAEGNVGLLTAMQIIEKNRADYLLQNGMLDAEKFFGTLELEIVHAMETYIDEVSGTADWESAVLARTNLLHEATKYMTEEMGRVPTIEELSEYTKISPEEIHRIRGLSEDAKRVAKEKGVL